MKPSEIREMARACGFELAGVAAVSPEAVPAADALRYQRWVDAGFAGEMGYLYGRRAEVRQDPRHMLPSARSVICVGKLYNTPWPYSTSRRDPTLAWISRYGWGDDYHDVVRRGLQQLDGMVRANCGADPLVRAGPPGPAACSQAPIQGEKAGGGGGRGPGGAPYNSYESRICVDTAPILERTYARLAGLGWIGKNTCLINQASGSWFFLGELLVSLEIEPDAPPPDRCGTCRRCIEACPTAAIVPAPAGGYAVDSRLCISYFTIELRSAIPEDRRSGIGGHVFGCDICQDVCPWNHRAPVTTDPAFQPRRMEPPLLDLAGISEEEFRSMFRGTPVTRARYSGFLRNVAVAMGNRALPEFRAPLEKLATSADPLVAEHAKWALGQIQRRQGLSKRDRAANPADR